MHLGHLCCVTDSLGSYLVTADHSQTRDKKRKEKERSEWGERSEWDKVRVHFLSVTSYLRPPTATAARLSGVSDESGSLHTPKCNRIVTGFHCHSTFTVHLVHRDANTQKHIFFYTTRDLKQRIRICANMSGGKEHALSLYCEPFRYICFLISQKQLQWVLGHIRLCQDITKYYI